VAIHLYTYIDPISSKHMEQAKICLQKEGLIAYPSDVNWAIAWNPNSKKALQKVQWLKPTHPKEQAFTLLCHSFAMVAQVGHVEHAQYRILRKLLPGPYTILLRRNQAYKLLATKKDSVGVRYAASPLMEALITAFGSPLASTSLDFSPESSGKSPLSPPRFGYEIEEQFGTQLDLILDLGEEISPQQTTILDCTDVSPLLVRQGIGRVEGIL